MIKSIFIALLLSICGAFASDNINVTYATPGPIAYHVYDNPPGAFSTANRGTLVDVNGDGLVDVVYSFAFTRGSTEVMNAVYLNTGKGWVLASEWRPPASPLDTLLTWIKQLERKGLLSTKVHDKLVIMLTNAEVKELMIALRKQYLDTPDLFIPHAIHLAQANM